MLQINKDYKCPFDEQLEQEWINWGKLLVDDHFNDDVTLKLDENGNIEYGDIPFPIELMTKDYA